MMMMMTSTGTTGTTGTIDDDNLKRPPFSTESVKSTDQFNKYEFLHRFKKEHIYFYDFLIVKN